jgi:hypothetical protein
MESVNTERSNERRPNQSLLPFSICGSGRAKLGCVASPQARHVQLLARPEAAGGAERRRTTRPGAQCARWPGQFRAWRFSTFAACAGNALGALPGPVAHCLGPWHAVFACPNGSLGTMPECVGAFPHFLILLALLIFCLPRSGGYLPRSVGHPPAAGVRVRCLSCSFGRLGFPQTVLLAHVPSARLCCRLSLRASGKRCCWQAAARRRRRRAQRQGAAASGRLEQV